MAEAPGKNRFAAWFYGIGLIGTPWIGAGYGGHPSPALCALNTVLMILSALVLSVVQVAVTTAVAHAVGDRVFDVTIGLGPVVFKRQWRSWTLTLRAVPLLGGIAVTTTRARGQRWRIALAHLAGATVMIAVAVLAAAPVELTTRTLFASFSSRVAIDSAMLLVAGFLAAIGVMFVLFVWGQAATVFAHPEGLRTLRDLGFGLVAEKHARNGAHALAEQATRRGLEESPESPILQLILAGALINQNSPEGFARIDALVARDLNAPLRKLALNLWAWAAYQRGDGELRARADEASRLALDEESDNPSLLDTRGHVLLWIGRFEEAERLLLRANERATNRSTRASSAAGMALLCVTRDRIDDAVRWLERARAEDEHHWLIARATAAIEPLRRT